MNILILVAIATALGAAFLAMRRVRGRSPARDQKFWLFYAGPENYLDENGERDFDGVEVFWSCEAGTCKGDLILLYRKSINELTVNALIRRLRLTKEVAQDIKKRGIGKDIPAIWQAVSDSKRQFFWGWSYGCYTRQIRKLSLPLRLEELQAVPKLKRWKSLRWNFQATGRSALEIPPFAWEVLSDIIERKYGIKVNQQSSKVV